jgi:methionine-rich copper-binding protein CopC
MKCLNLLAGISLALAAFGAQAHAHLKASTPQEGEVLMQAPASISLTFSESARITAVSLQKDHDPKQPLTAPAAVGDQISVAMPALTAGAYTLSWRVLSTDDNHIMSGELHFKVSAMKMDMPMKP